MSFFLVCPMRLCAGQDSVEGSALPREIELRRCPELSEGAQDAHALSQCALGIFDVSAVRQAASGGVSESELAGELETDSSQIQPPLKSDFRVITFSRIRAVRSCFSEKLIDLAAT